MKQIIYLELFSYFLLQVVALLQPSSSHGRKQKKSSSPSPWLATKENRLTHALTRKKIHVPGKRNLLYLAGRFFCPAEWWRNPGAEPKKIAKKEKLSQKNQTGSLRYIIKVALVFKDKNMYVWVYKRLFFKRKRILDLVYTVLLSTPSIARRNWKKPLNFSLNLAHLGLHPSQACYFNFVVPFSFLNCLNRVYCFLCIPGNAGGQGYEPPPPQKKSLRIPLSQHTKFMWQTPPTPCP